MTLGKPAAMCLTLHRNHYVISESLGMRNNELQTQQEDLDTASGYNVVRKKAVPQGWGGSFFHEVDPSPT